MEAVEVEPYSLFGLFRARAELAAVLSDGSGVVAADAESLIVDGVAADDESLIVDGVAAVAVGADAESVGTPLALVLIARSPRAWPQAIITLLRAMPAAARARRRCRVT
ncbi:MAG TPA: hypothetical protein VGI92_02705 [Gemmatimonadales bacterium]